MVRRIIIKISKTIIFRIMSKITVKHKGKSLTRTKRCRRYFARKPLIFLTVILDGMQDFISTGKNIFNVTPLIHDHFS